MDATDGGGRGSQKFKNSCSRRFQIPADGAKRREKAVYGIGDDAFDITVAPRAVLLRRLSNTAESSGGKSSITAYL